MKHLILLLLIGCSSKTDVIIPAHASFKTNSTIHVFKASEISVKRTGTKLTFKLSADHEVVTFYIDRPDFESNQYWCYAGDGYTGYPAITYYDMYDKIQGSTFLKFENYDLKGWITKYTGNTISLTFEGWFSNNKCNTIKIENGVINETKISL